MRLHRHSLHDYAVGAVVAGDGLVGACICERTSDFEPVGQIVVEVEARVETREVRPDYRTVLFHPAGAHGVDSLVIAAVDTDLMVLHESSAEDFVLPVRTASEEGNVAESLVEVSFAEHSLCKELLLIKGIFAQVHHVETLVDLLPCHVAVISDICMSCRSATGGHKHYAVGTGGAVDCAGRRVFKHVDADDVGGGDGRKGVDGGLTIGASHPVETLHGVCAAHWDAVDDVERLIGRIKGACATDSDGSRAARSSGVLSHLHSSHLALQHLVGVRHYGLFHLFL